MLGLLLRPPHAHNIVHNGKRWEVRSRATKKRGRIALIEVTRTSWRVVAFATLARSMPLTHAMASQHAALHQAPGVVGRYATPHAWVLQDVRGVPKRVCVPKKRGCVVWVKL